MKEIMNYNNILNIIKIALLIAVVLFFIIVLLRLIFYCFSLIISKIYPKKSNVKKNKKPSSSSYTPHDEVLLRDFKKEKKHDMQYLENVEKLNEKIYDINNDIKENDENIVGIIKPIGYWTSLILGEKLSELLIQKQSFNKNGGNFWVNLIKSKKKIGSDKEIGIK